MQELGGRSLYLRYLASCCPCSCGYTEYLGPNEQLLLETTTGKEVVNGPTTFIPSPMTTLRYTKRDAISLTSEQYMKIKDRISGEIKVVQGPAMYFLEAYETQSVGVTNIRVLSATDGIYVSDQKTGEIRLIKGPGTFTPGPFDHVTSTIKAIALHKGQYQKLENRLTGDVWIEKGEQLLLLEPTWKKIGSVKDAYSLKSNQFVRLEDSLTGRIRVEFGEQLIFPTPFEKDSYVENAIDLKSYEYCKIQDVATGKIRVERGEKLVWLGPTDRVYLGKVSGTTIDANTAALVQNKDTGLKTLVRDPGLFFPKANETVLSERRVIRLADHEAIVLKDLNGDYHYYYGDPSKGTARSFFMPPYWEKVQLLWSRGRRREKRDLKITIFDTRPHYMSFEFNCRTSDNVEMILEGTFFWEIFSLPDMMRTTSDAPGDVCNHARSCFIQLVSKVKLDEFMDTFNAIAHKAHSGDDQFYKMRGIKIHSLEVTQYKCAEQKTSAILQQIIMETTNRMNRLSRQESENEVALAKIRASVEQEKARSQVIKIKQEHLVNSSRADGEAEAEKAVSYIKYVEEKMESKETAQKTWYALRKQEALKAVAGGKAQVYFTPKDANITI